MNVKRITLKDCCPEAKAEIYRIECEHLKDLPLEMVFRDTISVYSFVQVLLYYMHATWKKSYPPADEWFSYCKRIVQNCSMRESINDLECLAMDYLGAWL